MDISRQKRPRLDPGLDSNLGSQHRKPNTALSPILESDTTSSTSAPKRKRRADQLEGGFSGTPQLKRVRPDPELDLNLRSSPHGKPVQRPVPPHVTDALEGPRSPREITGQYVKQTFALNRRHDSVRLPYSANSLRPGPGASPHRLPRQANTAQRPPGRDAEGGVARPGPNKHHDNRSPVRRGPVDVSLQGGGPHVASPRRKNLVSAAVAQTPARHPNRRLSSASPGQTSSHHSPHILDEVRAMDAKICPDISPEEMDMLREIYIASQHNPEKLDEYRREYLAYQQRLQAQMGLSGGKQPTRPQSASPPIDPRSEFNKPEIHPSQHALEQAHFKPTYSPRHGSNTIFRGGTTSPSNTPAAARQRPAASSPVYRTQQFLPETPKTGGNHRRNRSGPIPRIILKVPKRTQQANEGISPVKRGFQGDLISSPRKVYGPMGGKSLKGPPVEEDSLVDIDD